MQNSSHGTTSTYELSAGVFTCFTSIMAVTPNYDNTDTRSVSTWPCRIDLLGRTSNSTKRCSIKKASQRRPIFILENGTPLFEDWRRRGWRWHGCHHRLENRHVREVVSRSLLLLLLDVGLIDGDALGDHHAPQHIMHRMTLRGQWDTVHAADQSLHLFAVVTRNVWCSLQSSTEEDCLHDFLLQLARVMG